ncbi:DUF4886 domain-containing protein [Coraliomargarita parva]|uniref:DUF4886 domain-containing protein n=1 Tax=Coraliomargarita parva TaxID=3014050 RepID=UPI0022B342A6|nr:DUF4886 domain-containing protein [Coraliomargarita parva]
MRLLHPSLLLTVFLYVATALQATAEPIQILGVGNSFTANSQKYLPQIVASDPEVEADFAMAYIGGCPLDKHVNLAKSNEADPEKGLAYSYKINNKTVGSKVSLKHILQDREWDYVTIQQVSTKSYKIETYYPYAGELIDYIRQYAPQAKIVIHETWSHSVDSYRAKKWGLDPDDMYEKLHAAYKQIGAEFNLPIIPVGTAFQTARATDMWHYEPTTIDVSTLTYPEDKNNLPDQSKSMNNIFFWKKNKEGEWYVGNDGFHAGRNGEYLGGLVWYRFFFDKDPRNISYKPNGMGEAQAESLREIAFETVTETLSAPAAVSSAQ